MRAGLRPSTGRTSTRHTIRVGTSRWRSGGIPQSRRQSRLCRDRAGGSAAPCRTPSRPFPAGHGRCKSRFQAVKPASTPSPPPLPGRWDSSPCPREVPCGSWHAAAPCAFWAKRRARSWRWCVLHLPGSPVRRRSTVREPLPLQRLPPVPLPGSSCSSARHTPH